MAAVAGACAAVGAFLFATPPTRAAAQPISSCSTTLGVVVVVDFAHFGGQVERGCGADPSAGSTTGLQAMHTAGFATDGTAEYGTAFICRIADPATGVAQPATTPCTSTPPATAYWSYWHAGPGQTTWSISEVGVETSRPQPGGVTLWMFGSTTATATAGSGRPTGTPTLTPTRLRATNSTPSATPTTAPPTTPPGGTSGGASAPATTAPASAGAGGSPAPSPAGGSATGRPGSPAAPSAGSGSPPSTSEPAATTRPAGTGAGADRRGGHGRHAGGSTRRAGTAERRRIADVTPAQAAASASRRPASGSPLALIVGAVVVAVLAGCGAAVAVRRRRKEGPVG